MLARPNANANRYSTNAIGQPFYHAIPPNHPWQVRKRDSGEKVYTEGKRGYEHFRQSGPTKAPVISSGGEHFGWGTGGNVDPRIVHGFELSGK